MDKLIAVIVVLLLVIAGGFQCDPFDTKGQTERANDRWDQQQVAREKYRDTEQARKLWGK